MQFVQPLLWWKIRYLGEPLFTDLDHRGFLSSKTASPRQRWLMTFKISFLGFRVTLGTRAIGFWSNMKTFCHLTHSTVLGLEPWVLFFLSLDIFVSWYKLAICNVAKKNISCNLDTWVLDQLPSVKNASEQRSMFWSLHVCFVPDQSKKKKMTDTFQDTLQSAVIIMQFFEHNVPPCATNLKFFKIECAIKFKVF